MPVLLVRPREGAPDFDHEATLKHVLIALDGSPLAEQIVEPAVELAPCWARSSRWSASCRRC